MARFRGWTSVPEGEKPLTNRWGNSADEWTRRIVLTIGGALLGCMVGYFAWMFLDVLALPLNLPAVLPDGTHLSQPFHPQPLSGWQRSLQHYGPNGIPSFCSVVFALIAWRLAKKREDATTLVDTSPKTIQQSGKRRY